MGSWEIVPGAELAGQDSEEPPMVSISQDSKVYRWTDPDLYEFDNWFEWIQDQNRS